MDDYHYTFMETDGRTGADLTLHPSSDEVACELDIDPGATLAVNKNMIFSKCTRLRWP